MTWTITRPSARLCLSAQSAPMETLETETVRLTAAHLDQIRATLDWQALFDGLGLRKATRKSKANDWWAFSPFHEEKTPSFHMSKGGVWYDFSIGEGGGAIELVQRLKSCNCYEAGKFILENGWAHLAPVTTDNHQPSQPSQNPSPENAPIRQDLIPLTSYHELLEQRGISEETCTLLGIGYLGQGRSPLKGRIVFQVADGRVTKKSDGKRTRVIISHLGRAVSGNQEPKYLFYEGFHKTAELYGQELLWLHEDAAEQIRATGAILLTEGTFDTAKAIEAGLRNVVACFGASLSETQARKLKALADHFGISKINILFDRDKAGKTGAEKAAALLKQFDLEGQVFDWEKPVAKTKTGEIRISSSINDLADMSTTQITWLRDRGLL